VFILHHRNLIHRDFKQLIDNIINIELNGRNNASFVSGKKT